jgi:hypothetical protein
MRVERVWYSQRTLSDEERDTVHLVLKTGLGDFSSFLGPVGRSSFEYAERVAARLGVPLVVGSELQERVAAWRTAG